MSYGIVAHIATLYNRNSSELHTTIKAIKKAGKKTL